MAPHVNEEIVKAMEEIVKVSDAITGFDVALGKVTVFIRTGLDGNQITEITEIAKKIFGKITEYEILLPN